MNILPAAFASTDPERAKKTNYLTVFFALSGSGCLKAACSMLMTLTPRGTKGGLTCLGLSDVWQVWS